MSEGPHPYAALTRAVLRWAIVMGTLAILSGIAYQESAKKVPDALVQEVSGLRLDATWHLALVHGHMIVVGALVPLACLGMLFMARAAGFATVKPVTQKMLTRVYLPFAAATVALMLWKGYHVLLAVRGGSVDLVAIDQSYFGGSKPLRHAVYGLVHTGMAAGLALFAIGVWRSLRPRAA